MKKVKMDICINGKYLKNVYAVIESITDVYGNTIKDIKQNDFLQIGCNLSKDNCKYKKPCVDSIPITSQDSKSKKPVAKAKSKSKPIAKKKPIKKAIKKPVIKSEPNSLSL